MAASENICNTQSCQLLPDATLRLFYVYRMGSAAQLLSDINGEQSILLTGIFTCSTDDFEPSCSPTAVALCLTGV